MAWANRPATGGAKTPTPAAPHAVPATPASRVSRSLATAAAMVLVAVTLASCTPASSSPATTPATGATTTTTIAATPPTSTPATTTTIPPATTTIDRVAEIEAILRELDYRQLIAVYEKDEDAFRETFANDGYMTESLILLDLITFDTVETPPQQPVVKALDVYRDDPDCLVVRVYIDNTGASDGGGIGVGTWVLERRPDDRWGFSYAYNEEKGWQCEGPHPLGP